MQLPPEFQDSISVFSCGFSKRTWEKIKLLLLGALLCPGSRTVCNILRTLGLEHESSFHKYHRVLSCAKWSALKLSSILLKLLVDAFIPSHEPLVFAIDETIERRWGAKIKKRGIYRDPVRSSKSHFVKCSGLRWMVLALLTPLPWLGGSCWALPVLSALCPSERYYQNRPQVRSAKKLTDWAWQLIQWLHRYALPLKRAVYLVGDGSYATYELLDQGIRQNINLIVRMRLDARFFHFPTPNPPHKRGPKPIIGKRIMDMEQRLKDGRIKWTKVHFSQWYDRSNQTMLITSGKSLWYKASSPIVPIQWVLIKDPLNEMEPALLATTDLKLDPLQIINFFVRRWRIEVTFAEVRRHLGVETQRQWSDLAIERSTPLLFSLFSITTLLAHSLHQSSPIKPFTTAWYPKHIVSFSDVLCAVKTAIWRHNQFLTSSKNTLVDNYIHNIRYLWNVLIGASA